MLVVISDLHFTDATTGDLNVRSSAFRLWMDELCCSAKRQKATELCLVFLGDIFDLIRTEAWLKESQEDRPWGSAKLLDNPRLISPRCRKVAAAIAQNIATRNKNALSVISGRDQEIALALDALKIPIRRVYVPGNHDRLYRLDPSVRQIIDTALGIVAVGDPLNCVEEPRYGLVARHGHEFDLWNLERESMADWRSLLPSELDYLRVPIGDPITSELVAKLPLTVRRRLQGLGLTDETVNDLVGHIEQIEHVRPLHACFSWVFHAIEEIRRSGYKLKQGDWKLVVDAVAASVNQVYEEFLDLDFVKAWLKKHDLPFSFFDEADKLEAIGHFLKSVGRLNLLQELLAAGEKLGIDDGVALLAKSAQVEPGIGNGIHYVAYGHSHVFAQKALSVEHNQENMYFNSGTWRPRFVQAENHRDFVSWKEMSYLVFYGADEDRVKDHPEQNKGISFETWTGTKMKIPHRLPELPALPELP